jgi:hypothetical protein
VVDNVPSVVPARPADCQNPIPGGPGRIVGKRTIKAIDDELLIAENAPQDLSFSPWCIEQL